MKNEPLRPLGPEEREMKMGRVKDYYHDEICNRANDEPWGPEPDDLEMLQIDAERAAERLAEALKKKAKDEPRRP